MDYVNFFLFHSVNPLDAPTDTNRGISFSNPNPHRKPQTLRDGGNDGSWPGPCNGVARSVYRNGKTRWIRNLPGKAHRGPVGNETSWQCGNRVSPASDNQIRIYSGGWLATMSKLQLRTNTNPNPEESSGEANIHGLTTRHPAS
ncbi:uncharacterized protein EAE98_005703 [Botrytis deweyae]|uniref:Uncharacterized protein n=1 Tax=Botrytis deweyae TaxID=2478750 RepID=A0ABQ7IMS8_9HELO|nr:uncharacterized protein EAE98_005703 [Botrytis deweyae]KAF7928647.1 hypothetical protein EAE98_005703 [Botrytis deweyae]